MDSLKDYPISIFPTETPGKVMLTTCIQDVAEVGLCYEPDCLSEDEGWEVLQKKIFRRREYTDPEVDQRMEELGKEMIGWCRGIPLALVVLRGVLVTKATLYEWERFYINRTDEIKHQQLKGAVIEVLLFGYNELPYKLRPCFLYLANFRENEDIETEKLYVLWDAEGMILSTDRDEGETMINVAERYLSELVERRMVEAELEEEEVHSDRPKRIKSCGLHNLMRELCLLVVKNANFLKVNDYRVGNALHIENKVGWTCIGFINTCTKDNEYIYSWWYMYEEDKCMCG